MCRDEDALGPVIDALRPLRLNGTLRSVMHIGNDYKVLTGTGQYPWAEMAGRTPLDQATMGRLRKRLNVGAWNGAGGLYGTRAQVKEARRQVRQALKGKVDRLQFVDDRLIGVMKRFARPLGLVSGWDLSRTLQVLTPVYGLMKGIPTDVPMASAYWRKKTDVPADMDPDRDGCGLLWCSPVLPNTGAHALEVTRLATGILLEHGFEPQMSMSLATERSAICVITISYDRDVQGEDMRAWECYRVVVEACHSRGYPPYRLPIASMAYFDRAVTSDVIRVLKNALDPNDVLAPGRYCPD
jgi:4-cresol dehydrogenase (hydroxylating)